MRATIAVSIAVLILGLGARGPRNRPAGPGPDPFADEPPTKSGPRAAAAAEPFALGEMCLDRAAGGPAVSVLLVRRQVAWSSDEGELDSLVSRGGVPTFTVMSFEGKKAGTLTVAGPTDLGTVAPVATGSYAGSGPCAGKREKECKDILRGCGIAVGALGEAAPRGRFDVGGACVKEGMLLVDVDGDGLAESFPVASFLDELRAPADEVSGQPVARATCTTSFAVPSVVPGGDVRVFRGLDLLGVLDLDGDGRRELVVQYRYGDKRTWGVYSATDMATRLSLVAEVEPWGM